MTRYMATVLWMVMACSAFMFAQDDLTAIMQKANAGDPAAEVKLAKMYAFGQGVGRDSQEALKWFKKAADQGDPGGQFALGTMYETGRGVQQDLPTAVMLNTGWVCCTNRVGAWPRTTVWQLSTSGLLPIKADRKHNSISAKCTSRGAACRRTIPRP
jgi:hypothetical protein